MRAMGMIFDATNLPPSRRDTETARRGDEWVGVGARRWWGVYLCGGLIRLGKIMGDAGARWPAPSQTAGLVFVLALGARVWAAEPATMAATMPTTMAATAPATAPAVVAVSGGAVGEGRFGRGVGSSRSLPGDFDVLNRKSIFSKDRTRRPDGYERRGSSGVAVVRAAQAPVFKGAVLEDAGYVGFIENVDTGEVMVVRRGDKLPNGGGRVADLTLDYMDIGAEGGSAGATKRIAVGEDLLGVAAVAAAPRVAATTEASGGDGAAASTAPATTGTADDLIERLRRRRQQELGK